MKTQDTNIPEKGVNRIDSTINELRAAKAGTILADLSHLGLIEFSGEEARQFLHSQLSCDVNALQTGRAQYGSYNTPKGRMLASVLLWRSDAGYIMQLPRSLREPIQKRLAMFVLRTRVKAVDVSEDYVLLGISGTRAEAVLKPLFNEIPAAPLTLATDRNADLLRLDDHRFEIVASPERAPELVDALSRDALPVSPSVWNWTEIRAGIPCITAATQDQFVPQMANLDLIGGVSFGKGCYPGQEIVARVHHLGRLKQRMYGANIPADGAPQPGDKLFSSGTGAQASGTIVNAAPSPDGGHDVLAVIQIESYRHDDVHWKSPDGPRLKFLELPYEI